MCENERALSLIKKLNGYLYAPVEYKQTLAMQILAGRRQDGDVALLEAGGAKGLSTFTAYYLLAAYNAVGGKNALGIIKEYFGGMIAMGATSFWEDFDVEWTKNSFGIDTLPVCGKRDVHGDFGNFCYKGLRHSLCHGWAGGVLAYIAEGILGIEVRDGYRTVVLHGGDDAVRDFTAKLPTPYGELCVYKKDGELTYVSPAQIEVVRA